MQFNPDIYRGPTEPSGFSSLQPEVSVYLRTRISCVGSDVGYYLNQQKYLYENRVFETKYNVKLLVCTAKKILLGI